jgi:hypothetical protein
MRIGDELFDVFNKCFFWQGSHAEKIKYIESLGITTEESEALQKLSDGIAIAFCNATNPTPTPDSPSL